MQVSRRYRYVDDYRAVSVMDARGKVRQKAIYIGEWVCPLVGEAEYTAFLQRARLLTAAAVAGLIAALAVNHAAYETMYVAVPLVMALFPAAYLIMGACSLQKKAAPMEKLHFIKGLQRVRHSAMGVFVMSCIVLLGKLVFRLLTLFGVLTRCGFRWQDGVFLFAMLASAAASFVLYKTCREVKTELRPNEAHTAEPR
ncbi:MAG: hypothetical protein E7330_03240 [Clostridiales bacterium]|nr:hypothetical protein [Clostridiales bacterium]